MQKKKNSTRFSNKKHKKAKSVDKEHDRRPNSTRKKSSYINLKKDKVPLKNNHNIDCFEPQSIFETKFH